MMEKSRKSGCCKTRKPPYSRFVFLSCLCHKVYLYVLCSILLVLVFWLTVSSNPYNKRKKCIFSEKEHNKLCCSNNFCLLPFHMILDCNDLLRQKKISFDDKWAEFLPRCPMGRKEQLMSLKYNYSGLVERPWLLRILPDCPLGKCMYLDHQDWRFWDWELSFPWQWLDWVEYLHFAWSIEVPALASPPPRKPNQFRRLPRRWHSPVLWSHKVWLEKRNWRKFFSVLALI